MIWLIFSNTGTDITGKGEGLSLSYTEAEIRSKRQIDLRTILTLL